MHNVVDYVALVKDFVGGSDVCRKFIPRFKDAYSIVKVLPNYRFVLNFVVGGFQGNQISYEKICEEPRIKS